MDKRKDSLIFSGKYKSAYFEFKIKPEDSKFLNAWQELKNSKEFQEDYKTVKDKMED